MVWGLSLQREQKEKRPRSEGAEERVRLRAINTRGCVLEGPRFSSWAIDLDWHRCVPIRSRRHYAIFTRIAFPLGVSSPASFICTYVSITRAFTGVSRGKATRTALVRSSPTLIFFVEMKAFLCSLSFRWSVRPLILACTNRARLRVASGKEGRWTERQTVTKEHRWIYIVCTYMWRFSSFRSKTSMHKIGNWSRFSRASKMSVNITANYAFYRTAKMKCLYQFCKLL